MPKIEIQELIGILQNSFVPANAQGVNLSVQLELTGEGGGQWFMVIKDQKCQVESGIYPNPRASLSLDKVDLLQLLSGELNPMMAFFSGRVRISGDRSAVMKLASLFHIDQETINRFRN